MELIRTAAELRDRLAPVRRSGASVGLVPTMGALHLGHGRLIELARRETDCVVVSIFVNPIQFNQREDYERYPRDMVRDLEFCRARAVDLVFAPGIGEMYPGPQRTFVEVERLTEHLCGRFRPGHFRGVATVVIKLFNIVQPDRAYFGEKDAQQLAVIRRMVRDLNLPVEIVPVATVREPDGLALSSRNQRLSVAERQVAPALFRALQRAGERIAAGVTDVEAVKKEALEGLAGLRVEYLEVVDPEEMRPVDRIAGPVRVAAAVWIGGARLIDNMLCRPAARSATL